MVHLNNIFQKTYIERKYAHIPVYVVTSLACHNRRLLWRQTQLPLWNGSDRKTCLEMEQREWLLPKNCVNSELWFGQRTWNEWSRFTCGVSKWSITFTKSSWTSSKNKLKQPKQSKTLIEPNDRTCRPHFYQSAAIITSNDSFKSDQVFSSFQIRTLWK